MPSHKPDKGTHKGLRKISTVWQNPQPTWSLNLVNPSFLR